MGKRIRKRSFTCINGHKDPKKCRLKSAKEAIKSWKKMDRKHIKSDYCLKNATNAFSDLIDNANCKHILFSYNNTQKSKDGRSNARISDDDILDILNNKGKVDIFEMSYKAFTTGKSNSDGNTERIFYCKVKQ